MLKHCAVFHILELLFVDAFLISTYQHIHNTILRSFSSTTHKRVNLFVVPAMQDTNDVSCFAVNYARLPECWLNWDSIYSSRMAETWRESESSWQVWVCWYYRKEQKKTETLRESKAMSVGNIFTLNGPDSGLIFIAALCVMFHH